MFSVGGLLSPKEVGTIFVYTFTPDFACITFASSFIACSFGMTKFLLISKFRILSQNAGFLDGLLSVQFLLVLLLNTGFGLRLYALENIFFYSWSYIYEDEYIQPLVKNDHFRILIYLLPSLLAILLNLIYLALTTNGWLKLIAEYPQVVLAPAFCPFIIQSVPFDDEQGNKRSKLCVSRKWSMVNGLLIGCIPQAAMAIMQYTRVTQSMDKIYHESAAFIATNALSLNPKFNIWLGCICAATYFVMLMLVLIDAKKVLGHHFHFFRGVTFVTISPVEYITPPTTHRTNAIEMEAAEVTEPLGASEDELSSKRVEESTQMMPQSPDTEDSDHHFEERRDEPDLKPELEGSHIVQKEGTSLEKV